jgi:hypothetical protein
VLETSFADEERERQQKIESEQEKLRQLDKERQQLLAQRESEVRLTVQRQRDEQARSLEEERKRYEAEVKTLQEQQQRAHKEAERLRQQVQEQTHLRILAEQKQRQKEKESEEARRRQQQQQSEAEKARLSRNVHDDILLASKISLFIDASLLLQKCACALVFTFLALRSDLQPFYCRYEDLQIGQKLGLGSVGVTHRGIFKSNQVCSCPPLEAFAAIFHSSVCKRSLQRPRPRPNAGADDAGGDQKVPLSHVLGGLCQEATRRSSPTKVH